MPEVFTAEVKASGGSLSFHEFGRLQRLTSPRHTIGTNEINVTSFTILCTTVLIGVACDDIKLEKTVQLAFLECAIVDFSCLFLLVE